MAHTSEIYKLNGKSLNAAKRLYNLLAQYNNNMINRGHDPADIHGIMLTEEFNQHLKEILTNKRNGIGHPLGFKKPAAQVYSARDSYPRAYQSFPEVYQHKIKRGEFYMVSPIDYKGRHFTPKDGVRLSESEREKFSGGIFGNGWDPNFPLMMEKAHGRKLPRDFNKAATHIIDRTPSFIPDDMTHSVYQANFRSQHIIDDFKKRQKTYADNCTALMNHVTAIIKKNNAASGVMLRHDKESGLQVTISSSGATKEFFAIKDFEIQSVNAHDISITPNVETENGKIFKRLLDQVPSRRPDLSDYWQLANPTAPRSSNYSRFPRLHTLEGQDYLVYEVPRDKNAKDHSRPADSIKINIKDFNWLKQDQEDRQVGINPPPPPKAFKLGR